MRSNIFREAKISLCILSLVLAFATVFYFIASMFTSMGYEGFKKASVDISDKEDLIVIIDPGHGGEDPGAVANNLIEKDLNLEVAGYLNEFLKVSGYASVMTRTEDILLYNQGEEDKKKYYDVRNREAIAESYDNSVFVSIHMNKFAQEDCKGLQVFYSSNNENSIKLAEAIQNSIALLQPDNDRKIKIGNDAIYLMENLEIPAVLVECGFLSNETEASLLKDKNYKLAIAISLYCSISEYAESDK